MDTRRLRDVVPALLFLEIYLGSFVPLGLAGSEQGAAVGLAPIAVAYVLFEGIRSARPLRGLATGAFAFCVLVIGVVIGEIQMLGSPYARWREDLLAVLAFMAAGAVLGLLAASISWAVRRVARRAAHTGESAECRAQPLSTPMPIVVIMAVTPLLESVLMTLQWDLNGAVQGLLRGGYDTVGWRLLSFDRTVLVLLCALASYAVLRRRRWLRSAVAVYLVAGVVLAAVRLMVGVRLDNSVAQQVTPSTDYVLANLTMPFYPVVLSDYIRACGIEVVARAILCAVVIPWIYLSRGRKRSLGDAG